MPYQPSRLANLINENDVVTPQIHGFANVRCVHVCVFSAFHKFPVHELMELTVLLVKNASN